MTSVCVPVTSFDFCVCPRNFFLSTTKGKQVPKPLLSFQRDLNKAQEASDVFDALLSRRFVGYIPSPVDEDEGNFPRADV